MGLAAWVKPPRQVLLIFGVVAVASAAALGALAWQLLQQDRDLEQRRRQVQIEQQADGLVAEMQQSLAMLRPAALDNGAAAPVLPDGVVAVTLTDERAVAQPRGSLLYVPISARATSVPASFREGERAEFSGDPSAATARYSYLAGTGSPEQRAGALLRLARVHRKRGNIEAALVAYQSLARLDAVITDELPAGLFAYLGRIRVFETTGRSEDLRREAAALLADLQAGRWSLTKAQYGNYVRDARAAVPSAPTDDPIAITRSEAAAWLWERRGETTSMQWRALSLPSGSALVVWTASAGQVDGLIADSSYLATLGDTTADASVRWAISDPEGRPIAGTVSPAGSATVRTSLTTGLPWAVHVFEGGGQAPVVSPRRQYLILILGLVTVVLSTGWFLVFRSLARERQVARLQSDFVAAVSHEFRSPLTALTHAADLLATDRISTESHRRQTYQVLTRDTARLRSLVEGLLSFGRLEAGTPFHLEDADLVALTQSTIQDFQEEVAGRGYVIDFRTEAPSAPGRVDREAMTRALRNLLDNAVKYSPDTRHVEVTLSRRARYVEIAVRDHGIGIPASEQRTIFDRFVRGAESTSRRIQGTGIGLAMVRQILRGHGGDVVVSSTPGDGSVFTMTIPAVPAQRSEVVV